MGEIRKQSNSKIEKAHKPYFFSRLAKGKSIARIESFIRPRAFVHFMKLVRLFFSQLSTLIIWLIKLQTNCKASPWGGRRGCAKGSGRNWGKRNWIKVSRKKRSFSYSNHSVSSFLLLFNFKRTSHGKKELGK